MEIDRVSEAGFEREYQQHTVSQSEREGLRVIKALQAMFILEVQE